MPPAVQLGVLRRSHLRGPTMPCRPSTRQDDHASRTPDALFPLLRLVLAGAAARLTWPRRSAPRGIRWASNPRRQRRRRRPRLRPTGRRCPTRLAYRARCKRTARSRSRCRARSWGPASMGSCLPRASGSAAGLALRLRVRANDGHGRHLPAPERVAAGHRCLPQARHSHRRDPQPHARNTSPELIFCHFSAEGDAIELVRAITLVWSPLRTK